MTNPPNDSPSKDASQYQPDIKRRPSQPYAAKSSGDLIIKNRLFTGIQYYLRGVRLLRNKKLMPYILVPLLINVVIFFGLTYSFFSYSDQGMAYLLGWLPNFLSFIKSILWFIIGIILIFVYGYLFNFITNIVASPFYGMLAQKTEELMTGEAPSEEPLKAMIPRVLVREMQKILYFIGWTIVIFAILFIMGFIPLVNIIVPVIAGLWGAWCMAIQYTDYACDNNQLAFKPMRKRLKKTRYCSIGFGGTIMLASMVPILNIITMPAAVIGGTLYWLEEIRHIEEN